MATLCLVLCGGRMSYNVNTELADWTTVLIIHGSSHLALQVCLLMREGASLSEHFPSKLELVKESRR